MTPLSIVVWFARAYRAVGLEGCSSHSGRRTFITRAARLVHKAGGSLRDVQLLAGHRSIQTTQRYIDGDSDAQRKVFSGSMRAVRRCLIRSARIQTTIRTSEMEASIRFYHLNHPSVVDQRKELCSELRRRVEEADRYFKRYSDGDGTARSAFADAITDLKGRLAARARFSATARAMLMGLRGTHPVVDVVLASA
jgi:hypothetical protein